MKSRKFFGNFVKQVMLFSYLSLILVSVAMFFIGYHNVDLSVNFMLVEEKYNLDFADKTLSGKIIEYEEGYRIGHIQMMLGFLLGLTTFGGFMVMLYELIVKAGWSK